MTTETRRSLADHVIESLRAADYGALAERYAADCLLDMNLPTWRFQLQGPAAIRQYFEEQMGGLSNLRCASLRELVTDDAVVVESECRFDGDDGEHLWRAVDTTRFLGGEIVEHTQFCSGCWSPADIARHAAEAPMVRW